MQLYVSVFCGVPLKLGCSAAAVTYIFGVRGRFLLLDSLARSSSLDLKISSLGWLYPWLGNAARLRRRRENASHTTTLTVGAGPLCVCEFVTNAVSVFVNLLLTLLAVCHLICLSHFSALPSAIFVKAKTADIAKTEASEIKRRFAISLLEEVRMRWSIVKKKKKRCIVGSHDYLW